MSSKNRNAFSLDDTEQYIFSGNKSGELEVIRVDDFKVLNSVQAHYGSIETVVTHPSLSYIATLGKDRHICIWRYSNLGAVTLIHDICVRNFTPGDNIGIFKSTSQALAFHKVKMRLVGHTGDCGLAEIEFDEKNYRLLHCDRIYPNIDFATAAYVETTDQILTASVRGEVALSENGQVLERWDFGKNNRYQVIHWFEPLGNQVFLLASDGQRIIRFDLSEKTQNIEGNLFARDHLEHVTFNPVSGKAYSSSFDRNIYEVDPQTAESRGVVWKAPFKCRWIKTLKRNPRLMIVQCRNGGLFKVDLETHQAISQLQDTPACLWSASASDNNIFIAGESNHFIKLSVNGINPIHRLPHFTVEKQEIKTDAAFYTKRISWIQNTREVVLGRSNGELLLANNDHSRILCKLPAAVRDVAHSPQHGAKRWSGFLGQDLGSA